MFTGHRNDPCQLDRAEFAGCATPWRIRQHFQEQRGQLLGGTPSCLGGLQPAVRRVPARTPQPNGLAVFAQAARNMTVGLALSRVQHNVDPPDQALGQCLLATQFFSEFSVGGY